MQNTAIHVTLFGGVSSHVSLHDDSRHVQNDAYDQTTANVVENLRGEYDNCLSLDGVASCCGCQWGFARA